MLLENIAAAAAGVVVLLELGKTDWLVVTRQREARRALLLGRRSGIVLLCVRLESCVVVVVMGIEEG